tara:strand:+ start:378 stop:629 length:252 start_codon:yes stop_codon:yes gene_type:complete
MVLELTLIKGCVLDDTDPRSQMWSKLLNWATLIFILWVILFRARKCGAMAGPGLAPLHVVSAVVAPFWYWLSTTFMWGGQACA